MGTNDRAAADFVAAVAHQGRDSDVIDEPRSSLPLLRSYSVGDSRCQKSAWRMPSVIGSNVGFTPARFCAS